MDAALAVVERALRENRMALVVGKCRVQYDGRAASKLSEGDRLLIIKPDGTFLIHQGTSMKAVNYQGPGSKTSVQMDGEHLVVESTRGKPAERILVRFFEVHFADSFALRDDGEFKLFGTEKQLSNLLMQDLHLIEEGLVPIQQESGFRKGAIDILARDKNGSLVAIELKRRTAGLAAATQLKRYVDELAKRKGETVRGILCAPAATENTLSMLEREKLEFFKLDYVIGNPSAKIRGIERKQKTVNDYF